MSVKVDESFMPSESVKSQKSKLILSFVEDDVVQLRAMLGLARRVRPYDLMEVLTSNTVCEALDCSKMPDVDIHFIDVHLPGKDGFELAHKVRELKGKDTPIVIMSSNLENSHRINEENLENCYFLKKPFGVRDFSRLLKLAISN